jgi:hypothetical protein
MQTLRWTVPDLLVGRQQLQGSLDWVCSRLTDASGLHPGDTFVAGGTFYFSSQLGRDPVFLRSPRTYHFILFPYVHGPLEWTKSTSTIRQLRHRRRPPTDGSRPPEGLPEPGADFLLGRLLNVDLETRKIPHQVFLDPTRPSWNIHPTYRESFGYQVLVESYRSTSDSPRTEDILEHG